MSRSHNNGKACGPLGPAAQASVIHINHSNACRVSTVYVAHEGSLRSLEGYCNTLDRVTTAHQHTKLKEELNSVCSEISWGDKGITSQTLLLRGFSGGPLQGPEGFHELGNTAACIAIGHGWTEKLASHTPDLSEPRSCLSLSLHFSEPRIWSPKTCISMYTMMTKIGSSPKSLF